MHKLYMVMLIKLSKGLFSREKGGKSSPKSDFKP